MPVLSDATLNNLIREELIGIEPLGVDSIQPASVDLTLGHNFLVEPDGIYLGPVDLDKPFSTNEEWKWVDEGYGVQLDPGRFILGATHEKITVPDHLVARVEGKSSLARIGLLVHATAGYIDPGFSGNITLEFYNLSRRSIILRKCAPICQVSFETLSTVAKRPYGSPDLNSHYVGENAKGAVGSRYGSRYGT